MTDDEALKLLNDTLTEKKVNIVGELAPRRPAFIEAMKRAFAAGVASVQKPVT